MTGEASARAPFEAGDVDLLGAIIGLVPDLEDVARAAIILRRKKTKYPIESVGDLFGHLAGGRLLQLGERKIVLNQAERFFPKEFFPLVSEQDAIVKLFLVFHRGRLTHEREDAAPAPADAVKADEPSARIQGPAPLSE